MTDLLSQEQKQRDALPDGWEATTVGDLYEMVGGGTPDTKKPDYWDGEIPWISSADILGLREVTPRRSVTHLGIENSATSLVPKGSLIVVTRVGLGKVAIAPADLCFSQDSQALVGNDYVFPEYALHYLSTAVQSFKHQSRGTTISGVTKKQLAELPFLLPPLNEQRRIVEKIEELFTKLDAGVRSLKQTQALLKSYRRSVLKAAVEGELSREWREAHRDELEPASELLERILQERREKFAGKKYKEPVSPDASKLPALAAGWEWSSLEQLAWDSGYGTSTKCSYDFDGPPVLRILNISQSKISLEDIKFADQTANLKQAGKIDAGDLLIIRTNGSRDLIGRSAIVHRELDQDYFFASYLIRYRLLGGSSIFAWLAAIWHSQPIRSWMVRTASTSAGQYNISVSALNQLAIPLPPIEEQRFIVEEVERRLSVVEKLEATVEANLKQAGGLRQSILKRAFSGELVPQNPDDEPASVLLERIKKEREESKSTKKKQNKKPKAYKSVKELSLFPEE